MGEARTRLYRGGVLEASDFPVADVSDYLDQPDTTVWVDLAAPSHAELAALADELGLHELAVEDAVGPHQRPKLDRYETHLFLSCHALRLDAAGNGLESTEVDAFIHPRWLVTVHKQDGFSIDPVMQRWDRSPDLARHGVGFLLYGLLDVVVDGYFEALDAYNDYFEAVSDSIFAETPLPPSEQRRWFQMRQSLLRFHRLSGPLREVVSALMRREHLQIAGELFPYYQDVYDHVLRANESTEGLRDLVGTIVEANLSLRDYRQNQVMKKVTSWAAIIAVPTLITGYYGMNVPYPGSGEPWGVAASAALAVTISSALYALFRRKDWL